MAVILVTTRRAWPQWFRVLMFSGLGEAMCLTGRLFGSNRVDFVVAYFLLLIFRAEAVLGHLRDPQTSLVSRVPFDS